MKTGLLVLWGIWDRLYVVCTRLRYIEEKKNVFRIVLLRYRGETLRTAGGGIIRKGDLIVKLHLHNYYLATLFHGLRNETRMVLILRQQILRSLPQLASYLKQLPYADQIKGIVGTTMLAKGVEHLGFSVSEVPLTWFFRYKRWYLKWMIRLIHPEGAKRVKDHDNQLKLSRVYMSTEELFQRYLQESTGNGQ
jgi:hypothetical protein